MHGEVDATHTWGDSGDFTVTLVVRDEHGGVGQDQARVTVRNVPPTVDAGPTVFADRGHAITLEGTFTDPGWLDTHEGTWDFGDGCRPLMATIYETHKPPAGTVSAGVACLPPPAAIARHARWSTTTAESGSAKKKVQVVDVRNGQFEQGFAQWRPDPWRRNGRLTWRRWRSLPSRRGSCRCLRGCSLRRSSSSIAGNARNA